MELEAQLEQGDGLWAELVASPGVEVFGDGDSSGVSLGYLDRERVSVRYTAESAAAWTGELEIHTGGEVFVVPLSANEEVPVDDTDADGDGFTVFDGDCDDNSGVIHPLSIEVEDNVDNDCDGRVDEGFLDADRDGYATPEDCNDTSEWSSPEGVEVADGLDNDCNGKTDEGFDGEPFECPEPEQAIGPIDLSCDHGPGSPPLAVAWVAWLLLRRRPQMD